MAYIRIKKIKIRGKEYRYAYLVENRWMKRVRKGSKKGARQKVKGYLGKVYLFSRVGEREPHFAENAGEYFDEYGVEKAVRDLIRIELMNHGFEENGDFYTNGELAVYISDNKNDDKNDDRSRGGKENFFIKNCRFNTSDFSPTIFNSKNRTTNTMGFSPRISAVFVIKNLKMEKERKAVIAMNEGFLCGYTFERIINFKAKGNEKEIGLSLGNTLLEAGLRVPEKIFVEMVERMTKTGGMRQAGSK